MNSGRAVKIMLSLVIAVTLFHLCIVIKLIPYDIIWGGKLKTDSEMYVFESISVMLNLVLGLALLIKGYIVRPMISLRAVNSILWFFFALFGLNTIGNILAESNFEKSFAIITLLSSVLLWRILRSNKIDDTIS